MADAPNWEVQLCNGVYEGRDPPSTTTENDLTRASTDDDTIKWKAKKAKGQQYLSNTYGTITKYLERLAPPAAPDAEPAAADVAALDLDCSSAAAAAAGGVAYGGYYGGVDCGENTSTEAVPAAVPAATAPPAVVAAAAAPAPATAASAAAAVATKPDITLAELAVIQFGQTLEYRQLPLHIAKMSVDAARKCLITCKEECTICKGPCKADDDGEDDDNGRRARAFTVCCPAAFHIGCLTTWVEGVASTCPACRAELGRGIVGEDGGEHGCVAELQLVQPQALDCLMIVRVSRTTRVFPKPQVSVPQTWTDTANALASQEDISPAAAALILREEADGYVAPIIDRSTRSTTAATTATTAAAASSASSSSSASKTKKRKMGDCWVTKVRFNEVVAERDELRAKIAKMEERMEELERDKHDEIEEFKRALVDKDAKIAAQQVTIEGLKKRKPKTRRARR